ncbi:SDR family NAD(P)-dependent oxidoreductase [Algoriphagus confluentis]|uniref:(S)-benzoin forming benzil reductase n=1 Tax=Algoriphagus confluentis TaxID=1697556 RepID=A0ABQ6PPM6_9BACT|nr:(S)-benzoin forming benzil reductase [Algoriphagus confluentis]
MKTLLILTGHSKGLGKAIFDRFLNLEGNHVVAISRTPLDISRENVTQISLDLSDLSALEAQLPAFFPKASFDRYILINNAGWIGEIKPVGKLHSKGIQRAMNLNLLAPLMITNGFVKAYRDSAGEKVIVNISSGAAHKPLFGWSAYCSSKAGLAMFSKVAHEELKDSGFRVYSLAPGIVDTEMQAEIRGAQSDDFPALERFVDYKASQKLSAPREVAEKILRLVECPEEFGEVIQDVRNF